MGDAGATGTGRALVRRVRDAVVARPNRSLVLALVVAFAVRLAWVLCTNHTPLHPESDTARFLETAGQLADRRQPYQGGQPTASNAIGYPALLSPVVYAAGKTGIMGAYFAAALLNVVLGTLTVGLTAAVARIWSTRKAASVVAWLLALAPGQVYFTSVAMTETLQATLVAGGVLAGTLLARRAGPASARRPAWIGFGLLVGFAALVNPGGLLLGLVPALAVRARTGGWRTAARGGAHIALGALVLLVPWAVRNGTQVGVWSPGPSSNAVAICAGHRDGATGAPPESDDSLADCFTGTTPRPGQDVSETLEEWYAQDPDEGEWYRDNVSRATRWAVEHPADEVRLVPLKVWATLRTDEEAFSAAEDFGGQPLGPYRLRLFFRTIGDAWYFSVLTLAGLALVVDRRARRAWPIWGIPLLGLVGVLPFHGAPRYHHHLLPLVAVLAAHAVVTLRAGAAAANATED